MLDFLFNPQGRVSRKGIWVGFLLPQMAASIVAMQLDMAMAGAASAGLLGDSMVAAKPGSHFGLPTPQTGLFTVAVWAFFFWPSFAVPIKRFHDRGMTGWWVVIFMGAIGAALIGTILAFLGGMAAAASGIGQGSMASATVMAVVLVALLGAQFVMLYVLPGDEGENRYGPPPQSGLPQRSDLNETGETTGWGDVDAHLNRAQTGAKTSAASQAPSPMRRGAPLVSSGAARPSFGRRGA